MINCLTDTSMAGQPQRDISYWSQRAIMAEASNDVKERQIAQLKAEITEL